jgi:hypothetical protein
MPSQCSSAFRRTRKDRRREARILDDIVVDAYGAEERAMSWYYYLEEHLRFPFQASCVKRLATSPLGVGATITVTSMAPEDHCEHDMIVMIRHNGRALGVPLAQLEARSADTSTTEAIADWQYWISMGYQF